MNNTNDNPIAMLPCPFCGSEGAFCNHSEDEIEYGVKAHVECGNDSCRAFGPDGIDTLDAIKLWNQRP